jgi:methionyl-tRNA formyltransferase
MEGRNLLFLGSKAGGLSLCAMLCESAEMPSPIAIVCPEDRADPRSCLADFLALGERHGIPVHVTTTTDEVVRLVVAAGPVVALVHGWYRIIPVDRCPQASFYGFHYSALPRYRGSAPLVWQIIRGESRLGVSFFRFGAGIDDGPIVAQGGFELPPDGSVADALDLAGAECLSMTRKYLPELLAGRMAPTPQSTAGASYCGMRIPDDGRVNWEWPAQRVHDFVRGQTRPYPGAFTTLTDGRVLRVWRTSVDPRMHFGVPGSVVAVDGPAVLVACGDDRAVRLLEATVDGEAATGLVALIGSLRVRLGSRAWSGGYQA